MYFWLWLLLPRTIVGTFFFFEAIYIYHKWIDCVPYLILTLANEQVELVPMALLPRTDGAIQPAGWLGGPRFRWPPVFPQAAVLATARWMCCAGVAKARPRVGSLMGNKTYNTKVYIMKRF